MFNPNQLWFITKNTGNLLGQIASHGNMNMKKEDKNHQRNVYSVHTNLG